jgi:uncharacterized coiled-coil protein SlyX
MRARADTIGREGPDMIRGCLLLTVFLSSLPATAFAQARTDEPIRELLSEVKLLRQALERAATVGTRIQLLVARVQLQEQRIADLSRRLTEVRGELRNVEREATALVPQVAAMQEATQAEDMRERQAAEQAAAMLNSQVEALERRRVELTGEEGLLAQQIAAEQGRWTDFNSRLEDLERSLAKPK